MENTEEVFEAGPLVERFRNTPPGKRDALMHSWTLKSPQWMGVYREAGGLSALKTFSAQKAINTAQSAADVIHLIPELNGRGHRHAALEELRRFRHLTPEDLDLMQESRFSALMWIAFYLAGPDDGKYRN